MSQTSRHITILLCTYNGARFLPEQLASYLEQTHRNWSLWISDDGSTDATLDILRAFQRDHGAAHDIRILQGPSQGRAVLNFMSLVCHPDLPEGLVALSDQDDIWLPEKLERALSRIPETLSGPMIYSAQSYYIDDAGNRLSKSVVRPHPPAFSNAVMQNIMSGHSTVLNPAALALVRQAGVPQRIEYHDWWLSLLITAAGGRAVVDRAWVIHYRQHGANVLGAPGGVRAGLYRIRRILGNDYGNWITANIRALQEVSELLTAEHGASVRMFLDAPVRAGPGRVRLLRRLGFHRQSRSATMLVYIAAFLGKL
ncbi:glycosyltransferase [Sulfitobacter sabulilitoris]|uniref:Glycosyltransferase n=1 Tax=Sulfitobacter sabulilitoris TaxID=2562655 RepID=A0A5S3P7U9_9RHOB|nr:glycosyltransferase [Sulfitobacter sabulilitoris]TMM49375.1 glycosyltransferase [Sulfitobacter sabulilitoris]